MRTNDSWEARAAYHRHAKQMKHAGRRPRLERATGPGGRYPVRSVAEVLVELRRDAAFYGRR